MYPNWDPIFERLETTKQFGLLSDYLVSWSGRSGRLSPKVSVESGPACGSREPVIVPQLWPKGITTGLVVRSP